MIVITGETRTGKSTLGVELADALGYLHFESSLPLRRFFGRTKYRWEQEKDIPYYNGVNLRELAISVTDLIAKELGPDGYAWIIHSHLPKTDEIVLSGVRKWDEVAYFQRVMLAKVVILKPDVPGVQPMSEGVWLFPADYQIQDIETLLEEMGHDTV